MSNPQVKQKQSVSDKIAHVKNIFLDVQAAHIVLSQAINFTDDSDYSKEEELRLWIVASGAYNSCELDAIASSDTIAKDVQKQMTAAVVACGRYLEQFHRPAVLASLSL